MATEEQVKRVAQEFIRECGFGWYDDPMEGGQDAYDICQDALHQARQWLGIIETVS